MDFGAPKEAPHLGFYSRVTVESRPAWTQPLAVGRQRQGQSGIVASRLLQMVLRCDETWVAKWEAVDLGGAARHGTPTTSSRVGWSLLFLHVRVFLCRHYGHVFTYGADQFLNMQEMRKNVCKKFKHGMSWQEIQCMEREIILYENARMGKYHALVQNRFLEVDIFIFGAEILSATNMGLLLIGD